MNFKKGIVKILLVSIVIQNIFIVRIFANDLNNSHLNENNTIVENDIECKEVSHKLYLKGYPDNSIRANSDITRDEVAAILNRVYKLENKGVKASFNDLTTDVWSYEDLVANVEAGILKGYPDGTIRRSKPVTRAETAAMMVRLNGKIDNSPVINNEYKNHWGAKEIQTAYIKGYFIGYTDGSFKPDANITRAEFATTINRLIDRKYDISKLEEIKTFTDLNKNTTNKWYYEDMIRASNNYVEKVCSSIIPEKPKDPPILIPEIDEETEKPEKPETPANPERPEVWPSVPANPERPEVWPSVPEKPGRPEVWPGVPVN